MTAGKKCNDANRDGHLYRVEPRREGCGGYVGSQFHKNILSTHRRC